MKSEEYAFYDVCEANTIKDDYFTATEEEKQFVIKKINQ